MNLFKKWMGYIIITLDDGKKKPINVRSILRHEYFEWNMKPCLNSRIYFLDGKFINIQETCQKIDEMILKLM